MPDSRAIRPERTNVVSAFYAGAVDTPCWIVMCPPEYTTGGDAVTFTTDSKVMQPVTISAAELACLERSSQEISDPLFEGDDDL